MPTTTGAVNPVRSLIWPPGFLVLALLLGGCAIGPDDLAGLTPREQIYILKKDYEAKLDVVLSYARQPPCDRLRVVGCSDREIVVVLYRVAEAADRALDLALTLGSPAEIETARMAYQALVNELVRLELIEVAS